MKGEYKRLIAPVAPPAAPLDAMSTKPIGCWAVERQLRSKYRSALFGVRRASDNATRDIGVVFATGRVNLDMLRSFCAGTNGFVTAIYDQSGNGRNLTQGTNSLQPKIYDSVTGPITSGGRLAMSFDGVDDLLSRSDACGLSGDVACSLAWAGTWSGATGAGCPMQIGQAASLKDFVFVGVSDATKLKMSYFGATRIFNLNENGTNSSYYLASRNAGDNNTVISLRQNGSACTQSSLGTTGTVSFANTITTLGADGGNGEYTAVKMICALAYGAVLGSTDISILEAYMSVGQ